MTLQKALSWRYATKKFDPSKKIPQIELDELLEALRLSPSSNGLQPWKFLVITDNKVRMELRSASKGQPQVTDASHLIVLCARKDLGAAAVQEYMGSIAKTRKVSRESLKQMEERLINALASRSDEDRLASARNQVYIALGFLLLAAAEAGIDACPMEGFDKTAVDKILDLEKDRLASTVMCPVGFRARDDPASALPKVRYPKEEVFRFI